MGCRNAPWCYIEVKLELSIGHKSFHFEIELRVISIQRRSGVHNYVYRIRYYTSRIFHEQNLPSIAFEICRHLETERYWLLAFNSDHLPCSTRYFKCIKFEPMKILSRAINQIRIEISMNTLLIVHRKRLLAFWGFMSRRTLYARLFAYVIDSDQYEENVKAA